MERKLSALERQAADALRRARRLPVGANRNDLRQLAVGLLWLHRNGMPALVEDRTAHEYPTESSTRWLARVVARALAIAVYLEVLSQIAATSTLLLSAEPVIPTSGSSRMRWCSKRSEKCRAIGVLY